MNKMKVMTVVGTRPEIIKLSQIIKKLDENFDHTLVHTGQNYDYELNEIFFEELGLRKPDIILNAAGETSSQTIGNVIKKIERYPCMVLPRTWSFTDNNIIFEKSVNFFDSPYFEKYHDDKIFNYSILSSKTY